MPLTENKLFKINVSQDNLLATMSLNGEAFPTQSVTKEDILVELQGLKLVLSDETQKSIDTFARQLSNKQVPEAVVVSRGTPPVHDKHGRVEKLCTSDATIEGGSGQVEKGVASKSHYDRSDIVNVKDGQAIAKIIPPETGKDGVDVFGNGISRKLGREMKLKLGVNVRQEGDTIYATRTGKVEYGAEKIWVDDRLEINTDVDFSVGNIDFDGEVEIHKNVLDLFKVNSSSNIIVHGVIEAAEIHAKNDIKAIGGVAGKEKGIIDAGHDIIGKYLTNATVTAGNDVTVQSEIVNCDLRCNGGINVENGQIVGGVVRAMGGVKTKNLCSDAGVKTIVEVGISEELLEKAREVCPAVKKLRMKADRVRQIVEPLIQNQKYLNSEQKEKATELLYTASELDDDCDRLIADLRESYDRAAELSKAQITVLGTLYPGTIIRFPRSESRVRRQIRGPITIMPEKVSKMVRAVINEISTGKTCILEANLTDGEVWDAIEALLDVTIG